MKSKKGTLCYMARVAFALMILAHTDAAVGQSVSAVGSTGQSDTIGNNNTTSRKDTKDTKDTTGDHDTKGSAKKKHGASSGGHTGDGAHAKKLGKVQTDQNGNVIVDGAAHPVVKLATDGSGNPTVFHLNPPITGLGLTISSAEIEGASHEKNPVDTSHEKIPVIHGTFHEKNPIDTSHETEPAETPHEKNPVDTSHEKKPADTSHEKKSADTSHEKKPVDTSHEKKPVDTSHENIVVTFTGITTSSGPATKTVTVPTNAPMSIVFPSPITYTGITITLPVGRKLVPVRFLGPDQKNIVMELYTNQWNVMAMNFVNNKNISTMSSTTSISVAHPPVRGP